ncbi:MAG: 16S rRNA (cytosine(1402)-N(4))-methyltransferase RsmH [bacterium]|nr:16S rRNA (cytosine(1402)-N(4))-methyltransferase RsmH [bacterium]
MTEFKHDPVLLEEVLTLLAPKPNDVIIDATLGGGGHAFELLGKTGTKGKLLGIDLDAHALGAVKSRARERGMSKQVTLAEGHFRDIAEIVQKQKFPRADIIFFDLGLSSHLIEDASHGLSFQSDAPLDMRFGPRSGEVTAAEIVNTYSEDEIAGILLRYGGERHARSIAKAIVRERRAKPIMRTIELSNLVCSIVKRGRGGIHPATRTFQALRVSVNQEIEGLNLALGACPELLRDGGRLGVISYHSGEDRIAKRMFLRLSRELGWRLITRRVVQPSPEEVRGNPRSRSAKLRVIQKQ